jgi:hypothetical protein
MRFFFHFLSVISLGRIKHSHFVLGIFQRLRIKYLSFSIFHAEAKMTPQDDNNPLHRNAQHWSNKHVSTQHDFTESTATGLKLQNVGIAYCCFWSGTPEHGADHCCSTRILTSILETHLKDLKKSLQKIFWKKLYLGPISLSRKSPKKIKLN